MSDENSEKNLNYTNFLNAKNALIKYYTDLASAQIVRLLGFTAGIFTLLGVTQLTTGERLKDFCQNLPLLFTFEFSELCFSILRLFFLFLAVFVLMFFSIRATFRYAALATFVNQFVYVRFDEISYATEESLHSRIEYAVLKRIALIDKPKKVYRFSIRRFINYTENNEYNRGYVCSGIFALFFTMILMLLIW